MFTRMKDFNNLYFWEYYHWNEMLRVEHLAPIWQSTVHYERIKVKIEPAVFGPIEYYPDTPVVNWGKKPERGHDEVVCEGSGMSVFMTLWFTEQGYHAIVWDKEK